MDKTVHWDPELRKNQEEMLESLPEKNRDFAAFILKTGNVAAHYYRQREAEPTLEDFEDWLTGLPANIAANFRADGLEKSRGALGLRRHAAERNDIGLDDYMKEALSEEDYKRWKSKVNNLS